MKRDWWKIRHVLLELRVGKTLNEDDPVIAYHFALCEQSGFTLIPAHENDGWLTWQGHEAAALLEDSELLRRAHDELPCMAWDVLRPWLLGQIKGKMAAEEHAEEAVGRAFLAIAKKQIETDEELDASYIGKSLNR